MYAFLGLATTCYFSSQGAAKVIGPVLAQTARLLFIGTGGWWLSTHDATAQDFFKLAAASMVLLGVLSCISVMLTRWGPKQACLVAGAVVNAAALSSSVSRHCLRRRGEQRRNAVIAVRGDAAVTTASPCYALAAAAPPFGAAVGRSVRKITRSCGGR